MRALIPESDARPADVMIPRFEGRKYTCIDVTVINLLRLDLITHSASGPVYAVNHVFNQKWTKHGSACERAGMVFLSLPVDCLGA